jgi:hypothetical protein
MCEGAIGRRRRYGKNRVVAAFRRKPAEVIHSRRGNSGDIRGLPCFFLLMSNIRNVAATKMSAMGKKRAAIPNDLKPWIEAKKRHRLSQAHIQMARELGMNPRKFGGIDNHRQEPWKAPLPDFIESLYFKRFGKTRPDTVKSFVEIAAGRAAKKQAKRLAKEARKTAGASNAPEQSSHNPVPSPYVSERAQGADDWFAP